MKVSTFTIFTRQDLAAIQSGLNSALSTWADKWFVTTAALPAVNAIANAYEAEPLSNGQQGMGGNIERSGDNGAACQLIYSSHTLQHVYSRITGEHVIKATQKNLFSTIESTFLEDALDDLLATLLQTQSPADQAAPQVYDVPSLPVARLSLPPHKGSGTVIATITDQDSTFYLYLSQRLARTLCGAPHAIKTGAKLTSRKAAIGHGKLKIQITAGEAELRLADLMELRSGNVIRLNLKPNQPFTVQTDSHQMICHAYLGKRDGSKAIELINQ